MPSNTDVELWRNSRGTFKHQYKRNRLGCTFHFGQAWIYDVAVYPIYWRNQGIMIASDECNKVCYFAPYSPSGFASAGGLSHIGWIFCSEDALYTLMVNPSRPRRFWREHVDDFFNQLCMYIKVSYFIFKFEWYMWQYFLYHHIIIALANGFVLNGCEVIL